MATLYGSAQIELTNHCNYRCAGCPQSTSRPPGDGSFYRKKGYLSLSLFREIFEKVEPHTDLLNFSFFGEPTLHPSFGEILEIISRRREGLKVVMNTNLSRMTSERFDQIITAGMTELRISVDATTANTYEQVRSGGGVIDLGGRPTRDRFGAIEEKMRYWFGRKDHVPTRHVYTVSSLNVHELASYVHRWNASLGLADVILAKRTLTYGGIMKDPFVSAGPCHVWDAPSLTIDWRGRISPCNLDINMALAVADIREVDLRALPTSQEWMAVSKRSRMRREAPCHGCIDANNWEWNMIFRNGARLSDEEAHAHFSPADL